MEKEGKEFSELGSTNCGLNPNFAGALAYLLGFVTGFLFLFMEKENKFVRFHAIQSIITWVVFLIVYLILRINAVLEILVLVAGFVLWVMLIFTAYNGERFRLPIIGETAEKNS